jgi:acetyl/propionyl-CoA carboxylase alpha subunit
VDRADAVRKLRAALENTMIEGIATNLAFQRDILATPEFARGGVDTGFLARMMQKEPA